MQHKPLMPNVRALLLCRELFEDNRTGEHILVGPASKIHAKQFPSVTAQAVYLEVTSGRGDYIPALELRDGNDRIVWGSPPWEKPFPAIDPLKIYSITFPGLMLCVPVPGRYDLVLLLNGEEAARRAVWVLPVGQ